MLRTKKQQQKICETCPIAKTADLIGDSCVLLIIRDLLSGTKRFGELEFSLQGISTRTLSKKLKMLVEKGIVKREEFNEKPPRVEYRLSEKGRALNTLIKTMLKYGEKYL